MKSTWLSFALCCAMTSIGNVAAQERAPDFSVVTIAPILYQGQFNWDKALVEFSNDPNNPLGLSRTQRNAFLWLQDKARVQRELRLEELNLAKPALDEGEYTLIVLESFGNVREQVGELLTQAQLRELETVGFRLVAAESNDFVELFDNVMHCAADRVVKDSSPHQIEELRHRVEKIVAKLEADIRDLKARAATEILDSLPPEAKDKVLSSMGLKF